MTRPSVTLLTMLAMLGGTTLALAQSATSGGAASSSSGASGASPSSPAPSGGVPTGKSASGPETPVQKQADEDMKKDTTICKGC